MSHIALILPDLNGGGAQKMMINLANEFCEQDDRVDLILLTKSGVYRDLIDKKVNVIIFNKKNTLFSLPFIVNYFRTAKPEGIVSALTYVNLITIMAKILSGLRQSTLIISERNNLTRDLKSRSVISKFIYQIMIYFLYPVSNHIVGISNGVCDDLKNYIHSKNHYKIRTIYNPVITRNFEDKISAEVSNIFPEKCPFKIITSGRLENQKDYPTMLRALSLYKKKYGEFYLVILGKGSLQPRLKDLTRELGIQENVEFKGFLQEPLSAIKQADLFLISSAWEGFCNVIVEALFTKVKIISTDCPFGPAEILERGKYGHLVPVGNPEALCEAIFKSRNERINPEELKNRALEFSVINKAKEFKDLIQYHD